MSGYYAFTIFVFIDSRETDMTDLQEKRKEAVRQAADMLTVPGFTAVINLDSWEVDSWMYDMDTLTDEEYEELEATRPNWEHTLEIAPLEAFESFRIMEGFVDYTLPKGRFQGMMARVLQERKPFAHFNNQIHNSEYREAWFAYRLKRLEVYVKTLVVLELKGGSCNEEDEEEFYPSI